MKSLRTGMLAVSTTTADNGGMTPVNDGARNLTVARARAVHIISGFGNNGNGDSSFCVVATINGHQDAVQCLCELPNGDLLTGGGKMDATIKMWSQQQLYERNESSAPRSGHSGETREHVLADPAKTFRRQTLVMCLPYKYCWIKSLAPRISQWLQRAIMWSRFFFDNIMSLPAAVKILERGWAPSNPLEKDAVKILMMIALDLPATLVSHVPCTSHDFVHNLETTLACSALLHSNQRHTARTRLLWHHRGTIAMKQ